MVLLSMNECEFECHLNLNDKNKIHLNSTYIQILLHNKIIILG